MAIREGAGTRGGPGRVRDLPVTPEAVTWAFRLFIGRDPRDEAEIAIHLPHSSVENLRIAFAETREFAQFHGRFVKRAGRGFGVPPFLLRPPPGDIPWRFAPPTMETPVSQLCTAAQFQEPAFAEIAGAMGVATRPHRSQWEAVYIACVLATEGCIAPRKSAIGFGVRRERVASLLASRGVAVAATAMPPRPEDEDDPGSHDPLRIFYPEVVRLEDFEHLVANHELDLLNLPANLGGLCDALWSLGAVGRLGSLAALGDFVEDSLGALRPGGIAVHTMDLNLSSDEATIETAEHVVPRRRDIEALVTRLTAAGHTVLPVTLHPGFDDADAQVDAAGPGQPQLKAMIGEFVVGSFGLAIRKGG